MSAKAKAALEDAEEKDNVKSQSQKEKQEKLKEPKKAPGRKK